MRQAGDTTHGLRTRALIVILWRAGLRVSEALALAESDLDRSRGSVLVRRGKGGKRRQVGMDRWAWEQLEPREIATVLQITPNAASVRLSRARKKLARHMTRKDPASSGHKRVGHTGEHRP